MSKGKEERQQANTFDEFGPYRIQSWPVQNCPRLRIVRIVAGGTSAFLRIEGKTNDQLSDSFIEQVEKLYKERRKIAASLKKCHERKKK